MNIPNAVITRMMDVLLDCLSDENVEVRESASKMLSGVVRCSQRHSIIPLRVRRGVNNPVTVYSRDFGSHSQDRFVKLARKTKLPARQDANYTQALRTLHSALLGICALIDSFPYSVEPWMPPLTDGASSSLPLSRSRVLYDTQSGRLTSDRC